MYVTDTAYKCVYRWDITQCNIHPAQATVVSSGSGGWRCIQALWSHSRHFHTNCCFLAHLIVWIWIQGQMRLVRFFAALKFFQDLCQKGGRVDRTRQKLHFCRIVSLWETVFDCHIDYSTNFYTDGSPKRQRSKTSSAFLNAQQVACFL